MIKKVPTYEELQIENENLKKQLSEKKDIEKELAKTRILMRAAFDQSPVPMVVATYPDFTFKIINRAMENFVLAKASDYLNKTPVEAPITWKDCSPDGTPHTSVADLPLPMAMRGITTMNKESIIIRHDGSIVWGLASAAPIYDDEGQLIGGIYAATDITERKKTEQILLENEAKLKEQNEEYESLNEELREANEQLRKAKQKAEESDRLKTAFLNNMSHEIRTPMNAIMGFSDLLLINAKDKSKLEKFTKIISQRCNDLLAIINDILDISMIESGQFPVNFEECDLNEMFVELASFFAEYQNRIDKRQILFSLQSRCEASDNIIVTDKVKLKQILINLINNAFKFTEKGKIEGGCQLDENQNLRFYISDTGIGIPKDKQSIIFERFTQLNQGSRKNYGGTGLGLSIVKALVNILGGEVFVESVPGKGSTFSFTISYKKAKSSGYQSSVPEKVSKENFPKKTILIVEDDLYNAEYIKEILSGTGIDILLAENGKDAIEMTLAHNVDLILMDIRLPDIDGYEVTRQIKKHKSEIKIIAQTAYATQDERQKALNTGCIDYISKPTKHEMLLSLIRKHL